MKSANSDLLISIASCSIALSVLNSFVVLPPVAAEQPVSPKNKLRQFSKFYNQLLK
ncbi:MAG: hypothetical protein QG574_3941 [Cyanobacteriota bacterium erpe_2018_sw_21hr_WHONDRS-SW48-000092_B_bin.40]|jgi:hypothetical protein|nr:hypothetical protein [Cyanobacteriota bacterium erpe_2018_sw_21hr_WHONDRS-SW48-000092_B_bin.40]